MQHDDYRELANKFDMFNYLYFTLDLNIDTEKVIRLAAKLLGWQH